MAGQPRFVEMPNGLLLPKRTVQLTQPTKFQIEWGGSIAISSGYTLSLTLTDDMFYKMPPGWKCFYSPQLTVGFTCGTTANPQITYNFKVNGVTYLSGNTGTSFKPSTTNNLLRFRILRNLDANSNPFDIVEDPGVKPGDTLSVTLSGTSGITMIWYCAYVQPNRIGPARPDIAMVDVTFPSWANMGVPSTGLTYGYIQSTRTSLIYSGSHKVGDISVSTGQPGNHFDLLVPYKDQGIIQTAYSDVTAPGNVELFAGSKNKMIWRVIFPGLISYRPLILPYNYK